MNRPSCRNRDITPEPAAAIVARIAQRLDDIGRTMASRYRDEILDYRSMPDEILYGDVAVVSVLNFQVLLTTVETGAPIPATVIDELRRSAARRVHQGISLESFLHAYRLWCQYVWETVMTTARATRRDEREAALRMAGKIIEHMNVISTVVAQAYIDEAEGVWSDREVVRRDLVEAMLAGQASTDQVRTQASAIGHDLRDSYVVVLVARAAPTVDDPLDRARTVQASLRHAVEVIKARLRPDAGAATLVGLRHEQVVVLYPADRPGQQATLRRQCDALASTVAGSGFFVGIGGWHAGPEGIATSYADAREALEIAIRAGTSGVPVSFDDVVLEHIARSSPRSKRLLAESLRPLRAYDEKRGAELVTTLRAYMESGFNLTRSAAALSVNPNTVVYRLRRVKELTGRDPHRPDDLLLLCLSLKLEPSSVDGEAAIGLPATDGA
ncbi:MAG: helix-turn-helix domain-containing protein [Chloroflexota bacterium]